MRPPNQSLEERVRQLTLMNNLYMAKFFEGQPQCAEAVLRAVLGKPSLHVVGLTVERELVSIGSRSVWLDVSAVDQDGRLYDIEVQRDLNRATPRRARLHAALMDASALPKGADFASLPESYVVFITDGNAFGDGIPLSRIERTRLETGLPFGDGSHIVFADATYNYGNTKLGAVMHDFVCPEPSSMRCPALAQRARYLKETEEGIAIMGDSFDDWEEEIFREAHRRGLEQGIEQGIEQGLERGIEQGIEEGINRGLERGLEQGAERGRADAILRLMRDGALPIEKIASIFETTPEAVKDLVKDGGLASA